jgi:hypothetical protein
MGIGAGACDGEPILEKCDKLSRMLRGLIRAIQEKTKAEG